MIDEISQYDCHSYLKRAEHLLAEPLQRMVWDDSRHLIGECITFLKATPQERFTKVAANGDVCFTCLTRGCPIGKAGRCLNRNWALVCSQCKDEEDFRRHTRPGWKPKNTLICERHKMSVDVPRWIELFPLTTEGKGFFPEEKSSDHIENKTSAEFLRASFTIPSEKPRNRIEKSEPEEKEKERSTSRDWHNSLLSVLSKVQGKRD